MFQQHRVIRGAAGLMIGVVTIGGCSQKGGALEPARGPDRFPGGGMANPFAPVAMRIHPLTRRSRDPMGRTTIEAHIELLDLWGHSVKGVGKLRFEFESGARGGPGDGDLPGPGRGRLTWEIDISDPAIGSRGYYDAVTRTYMVTLGLTNEDAATQTGRLRVTFVPTGATALTDSRSVEPIAG